MGGGGWVGWRGVVERERVVDVTDTRRATCNTSSPHLTSPTTLHLPPLVHTRSHKVLGDTLAISTRSLGIIVYIFYCEFSRIAILVTRTQGHTPPNTIILQSRSFYRFTQCIILIGPGRFINVIRFYLVLNMNTMEC